jgi:hypothetical protein
MRTMLSQENIPQEQGEHTPMVEDIPSHEIYSSLLGIKRRPPDTSVVLHNHGTSSTTSTGAAIIERDDPQEKTPKTAFGQTYAKSQELQLSSLLLGPSNKGFTLLWGGENKMEDWASIVKDPSCPSKQCYQPEENRDWGLGIARRQRALLIINLLKRARVGLLLC